MNLLDEINSFVSGVNYDESFSSLLKNAMDPQLSDRSFPSEYFYLTELVNPIQAYYSRKHPRVKKSRKLARKLSLGNRLHALSSFWFRKLPDFIVEEATLDGIWMGVPGVRGKIDYKIGNSLFELKTKEKIPNEVDEVFLMYPHDLEQLVFYSVIHPNEPKINYLVFMSDYRPFNLKVFRVEIKELSTIKSILKNRISSLKEALESGDPSHLGHCRYYESGCEFNEHEVCFCKKLKPIDTSALKKSIEISLDQRVTKILEESKNQSGALNTFSLSINNIIAAPRKHYLEEVECLESPEFKDAYYPYKACLWQSMRNLKKQLNVDLNKLELRAILESNREPRAKMYLKCIKYKTSMNPEGEIVPYLMKASATSDMKYTSYPSSYNIAELGAICAIYGKNKGLLIVLYPELDKLVKVFGINYKNVDELMKIIRGRIDKVQDAEQKEDLLSLPPCPSWMNDEGKCPLMEKCHSIKGRGCTNYIPTAAHNPPTTAQS